MTDHEGPVYSGYSSYLSQALFEIDKIVDKAKDVLHGVEFDTFVGTGLSGALVVPVVARAMNKRFAIVRKDKAASHGEVHVEGTIGQQWIFLDDLIATGATLNRVQEQIRNLKKARFDHELRRWVDDEVGSKSEYVGHYMYYYSSFEAYKPKPKDEYYDLFIL